MQRAVSIIVACLTIAACASKKPKSSTPSPEVPKILDNQEFDLSMKATKGDDSKTFYHSDSAVEDFEDGQKVRDHEEIMDFVVRSQVIDAVGKAFAVRTTTIEKDGTGSLHDFAFPEPDEHIDFIYTTDGRVLKADPFPKESIFYLPPVSLPGKPVKIGDTWTMNHFWISSNDGLPLTLSMVTIFKGVTECGGFGLCADLEVSGKVDVDGELQGVATFTSKLWGRILFSFEKGDVIWSEVRSHEAFKSGASEMRVLSCMVSKMQNGVHDRPTCQPSEQSVAQPTGKF